MSTEYKFVSFRQPISILVPDEDKGVSAMTIDFLKSIPEVAEQMDGWEVVNTQIIPLPPESFLWVFTLKLKASVPDGVGPG